MKSCVLLFIIITTYGVAHSQSRQGGVGRPPEGSLTVSAVVESSVSFVTNADGTQELVVANAPDPKDSFNHPPTKAQKKVTVRAGKTVLGEEKKASSVVSPGKETGNQHEASVQWNFPVTIKQIETIHETIVMQVSGAGKSERQQVDVTTLVTR